MNDQEFSQWLQQNGIAGGNSSIPSSQLAPQQVHNPAAVFNNPAFTDVNNNLSYDTQPTTDNNLFMKLAMGVANPFFRLGQTINNVGSATADLFSGNTTKGLQDIQAEGFIPGEAPIRGLTLQPGTSGAASLFPTAQSLADNTGEAAALASNFIGGEGASDVVAEGAQQGLGRTVTQGIKEGSAVGFTGGAGEGLQNDGTFHPGKAVADTALGTVGGGILGGLTGLASSAFNTVRGAFKPTDELSEVVDTFRPTLSWEDQNLAASYGSKRTVLKGANQEVEYTPSPFEQQVAQDVKPLYDQGTIVTPKTPRDYISNIDNINAEIDHSKAIIRNGLHQLDESDTAQWWTPKQLKSTINNSDIPISLASTDARVANIKRLAYQVVEDELKNKPATTETLLDIRQRFDDEVRAKFGKTFYEKESTPFREYVGNIRNDITTFTADQMPEGQLPTGQKLKAELLRQSHLISAREGMASLQVENMAQHSTDWTRWAANNPGKARLIRKLGYYAPLAVGAYPAIRYIGKKVTGH